MTSSECGEFRLSWEKAGSGSEGGSWAVFYREQAAAGGEAGGGGTGGGASAAPLHGVATDVRGSSYVARGLPAQTQLLFYLRHAAADGAAGWSPLSKPSAPRISPASHLHLGCISAGGWSPLSKPSAAVASALGSPPAKPSGLRFGPLKGGAGVVSCAGLVLEWERSSGCAIDDYRLQVRMGTRVSARALRVRGRPRDASRDAA